MTRIRIGTRSSKLARWQATWTAQQLTDLGHDVETVFISTDGDKFAGSIQNSQERGLFTKRIQRALLDKEVDLAVHSLKDLPTDPIKGLSLAAVPKRENPIDVLISSNDRTFEELPDGSRIGTGSWRRQSQLLNARQDISVLDIRGNVDTRLAKLDSGEFDAIVLAYAGMHRLGLDDRITQQFSLQQMLPAVGQGALGLETRSEDQAIREAVAELNDASTHAAITAERAMLFHIGGGCLAPIGAHAELRDATLHLSCRVLSQDGRQRIDYASQAAPDEAASLGQRVAEELNRQGAQELIAASRSH